MKIRLAISLFFVSADLLAQSGFFSVSGFGSNPGNLNMYAYVPPSLSGPRPLVVALHGCSQNASTFAAETGWNTLALRHSFYVIYPEQNTANNASGCFNWFQPADYMRNQGEAYSIKQMVDHMRTNYNIDSNQVFVTGLSAGGCMTSVMLACYPEVFNKGAVMAGCPYQSASNSSQAVSAMQGAVTNTPAGWAALVTGAYPGYTGAYPQIAIFHGSADNVVNIGNQTELMKQWTGVHQANQTADLTLNVYNGNSFISKNMYADNNGLPVVETYTINGMYHGIALDTGQCYQQCGKTGTFSYEVLFSSTFFAAHFFNILAQPYGISGPSQVTINQNGVTYSVPYNSGSTYSWTAPPGAIIASGQGSNQVSINFSNAPGPVEVTETISGFCKNGPVSLFVNMGTSSINENNGDAEIRLVQLPDKKILLQAKNDLSAQITIYSVTGQKVYENTVPANTVIDVAGLSGIFVAAIKTNYRSLCCKLVIP